MGVLRNIALIALLCSGSAFAQKSSKITTASEYGLAARNIAIINLLEQRSVDWLDLVRRTDSDFGDKMLSVTIQQILQNIDKDSFWDKIFDAEDAVYATAALWWVDASPADKAKVPKSVNDAFKWRMKWCGGEAKMRAMFQPNALHIYQAKERDRLSKVYDETDLFRMTDKIWKLYKLRA